MSEPDETPERRPTALDALEHFAVDLEQRQRYSEKNRLALLATHGIGLVIVGVLLAIDHPARAVQNLYGEWTPLFNALPTLGGGLLLLGLIAGRRLVLEATGMLVGLTWDVGMITAFVLYALAPPPPVAVIIPPSTYPIAIYGTLAVLMAVHLVTLFTIIRDGRHG